MNYSAPVMFLQDSMVICRVKKNSDFRQNDTTNRTSSSQQQLSTMHNNNCAVSDVGGDQGDKTVECQSKKCSSSNDSYSIEQIDSASESNKKFTAEVTQPESSGHQKVHYFYALYYPCVSVCFWTIYDLPILYLYKSVYCLKLNTPPYSINVIQSSIIAI